MSDSISRQQAIDALESIGSLDTEADKKYARSVFEALPSVNSQPKTGYWMDRFPAKECKCSVCDFLIRISNGSYIDMVGQMKYCPNCGARMVEPRKSEDKE